MANNAKMFDVNLMLQAGINPKNGLPVKFGDTSDRLPEDIRKQLRIVDEQDAIGRYRWYNLPDGLNQELIERVLYYCGQGMLFFEQYTEKYYFLPYTLQAIDGVGIDVYGRFRAVTPVPFKGTTTFDEKGKAKAWINGLIRRPLYDINDIPEEEDIDYLINSCVLLSDYCKQSAEINIARQIIQDPLLSAMSEIFPFARTSLIANSGVKATRVNNEDEASNVKAISKSITYAAKTGEPFVPVVGTMEFQDLTSGGSPLKSEEFLLMLQAMDNYRLSLYGLQNGGLFQKKSHMLEGEQEMNTANNSLVYNDGLRQRQEFCDKVNALWGLGIWCEPSESAINIDNNMDGNLQDEQDQSGEEQGDQPVGGIDYE